LYTVQENIGLTLANKLTTTHLDWKRNVMKVKIAAQTFSSSVADALDFFRQLNIPDFKNCKFPRLSLIHKTTVFILLYIK